MVYSLWVVMPHTVKKLLMFQIKSTATTLWGMGSLCRFHWNVRSLSQ